MDNVDGLSSSQLRELVVSLLAKVTDLERTVTEQREEIARLKRLKGRPDIKPSGMDKATEAAKPARQEKRRGRGKVRPRVSIEDRHRYRRLVPRRPAPCADSLAAGARSTRRIIAAGLPLH